MNIFPRRYGFEDVPRAGPGTELAFIIEWFTLVLPEDATCGCEAMRQQMDRNGREWCREHRDGLIVPQLMEHRQQLEQSVSRMWKGTLQAIPDVVLRKAARIMVNTAIRRSVPETNHSQTGRKV